MLIKISEDFIVSHEHVLCARRRGEFTDLQFRESSCNPTNGVYPVLDAYKEIWNQLEGVCDQG